MISSNYLQYVDHENVPICSREFNRRQIQFILNIIMYQNQEKTTDILSLFPSNENQ